MRKLILTIHLLFCLFYKKSDAQINLIPNYSFEDTLNCGDFPEFPVMFWTSVYGSPDYFNNIMPNCLGANQGFNNLAGYQIAHYGNAYLGFDTYALPNGSNFREVIQAQLLDSLKANKKYCVSFYVNLANNTKYATDDIGAYFSISSSISFPEIAQINNPSGNFITDTVNWTLISGIMTAQGGEKYINIGNFKNDANTTVIISNSSSSIPETYYFIDDVSMYELPDINAGINDSINIGSSTQLNASCTGCWAGLQYHWFPSIGLSDSTILNPVVNPTQTTTYYFGLTDTTGNIPCMVDYIDSVTIYVKGVGVNELKTDNEVLKIYPNPTDGNFTIEFSEAGNYKIELINNIGDCIYRKKINSNKTCIDALLSKGVYILKITDADNKVIRKKIIRAE